MHIDDLPPAVMPGRWINEHVPGTMKLIPGARYYALTYSAKRAIGSVLAGQDGRAASTEENQ